MALMVIYSVYFLISLGTLAKKVKKPGIIVAQIWAALGSTLKETATTNKSW